VALTASKRAGFKEVNLIRIPEQKNVTVIVPENNTVVTIK